MSKDKRLQEDDARDVFEKALDGDKKQPYADYDELVEFSTLLGLLTGAGAGRLFGSSAASTMGLKRSRGFIVAPATIGGGVYGGVMGNNLSKLYLDDVRRSKQRSGEDALKQLQILQERQNKRRRKE